MESQIQSAFKILQYLFRQKNYSIKNIVRNFVTPINLAVKPQVPSDQCSWALGFVGLALVFLVVVGFL